MKNHFSTGGRDLQVEKGSTKYSKSIVMIFVKINVRITVPQDQNENSHTCSPPTGDMILYQ